MTRLGWPLQRALFGATLFVALCGLGLFACLSYLLVSRVVRSAFTEHFQANERLFVDSVRNDILTGLDFEVYRKCKLFHQTGGIHSITITSSSGRKICDLAGAAPVQLYDNPFILKSTIYFDERSTSPAATTEVHFKNDTRNALIRNFILVLGFTTLCLAVILGALARVMSRVIAVPIRRLSELLQRADLAHMSAANNTNEVSPISEVRILYRTTSEMAERLTVMQRELIQRSKEEALANMAAQVAHDIRSPLAAMEVAAGDLSQVPEDKRILIRAAANRIRDIANSLLERRSSLTRRDPVTPQPLYSLLHQIVAEKQLQFSAKHNASIELGPADLSCFVQLDPTELKRVVSNLINNAFEALSPGRGGVRVGISRSGSDAVLRVEDDGKGIPPDILARLGRRGETHGKSGGSGLGLHHARACAETWGGRLDIRSEVGKGTDVTLTLPLIEAPAWSVAELTLKRGRSIVILDDDDSIHQVWRGRLTALASQGESMEVVHAHTPAELRAWVRASSEKASEALYLLDYELAGHEETGLSLAEELGIGELTVLVTSRDEEPAIQAGCLRLNARLIPKTLARLVPLKIVEVAPSARERWNAILIDDDALTRATWQTTANRAGKRMRSFSAPDDFFRIAESLDRSTPVYVDFDLGPGISGTVVSERIHALGFKVVYLTTGHEPSDFTGLTHLSGIIGKAPPWA